MLKCEICGAVFNKNEYTMADCPACGTTRDQCNASERCEVCGEYKKVSLMFCEVCLDCLKKHEKNIELCERMGEIFKSDVCLNGLYFSVFGMREIEHILREELRARVERGEVTCWNFIAQNAYSFAWEVRKK